jgi:DNA-binding response OmpR family regulator
MVDAMPEQILIADDEPALVNVVRYALEREGYAVHAVADGSSAMHAVHERAFDLAILDIVMPGVSGRDVCRELRARSTVPIIFLTARRSEVDVVVGLEAGADDYVCKPFSVAELVARVHALLRRRRMDAIERDVPRIVAGELELDVQGREVRRDGEIVEVTASEFEILRLLASAPGQVFSRRTIMEHLWNTEFYGDERTADAHVSKLRAKIERNPARPALIVTVRGAGYKLAAGAPQHSRAPV